MLCERGEAAMSASAPIHANRIEETDPTNVAKHGIFVRIGGSGSHDGNLERPFEQASSQACHADTRSGGLGGSSRNAFSSTTLIGAPSNRRCA